MQFNPFSYPKKLYNEGELLDIYKSKFPRVVAEYEKVARKTYCNPKAFREETLKRVVFFDRDLDKLIKRYSSQEKNLKDLIKIGISMHQNYAFNFWLISYAMIESPLSQHYVELLEELLHKLYPKEKEFEKIRDVFIRTDFDIFYHKIMADSVYVAKKLSKISEIWKKLERCKKLSREKREQIFEEIVADLRKLKSESRFAKDAMGVLAFYIRQAKHIGNPALVYNIFHQAIDSFEENKKAVEELNKVGRQIKDTLKLAEEKLQKREVKKLRNLYLIIKEMLRAKDSTFGRRDPKMIGFWVPLTKKIIDLAEKELKIKTPPSEKSFLLIPWTLEDKLPQRFKKFFQPHK